MAILVATGSVNEPYEILDAVFAIDFHKESFFGGGTSATIAFDKVKEKLRTVCKNMGGDAVINCQFQYRECSTKDLSNVLFGGAKAVMEIFAYGTAVKLTSSQKGGSSGSAGKKINCAKCRIEIPAEAGFCPECGTKV